MNINGLFPQSIFLFFTPLKGRLMEEEAKLDDIKEKGLEDIIDNMVTI
ncbi:MAG TPA: hypothetical protein VNM45_07065 [Bacillus sp. (in: firmicutes)]|nr:hypothetical protein [Bacillus sp. (in: firmicutes)]